MSFLRRNLWACALLLTGAAFVGLGAWRGEAETVLRKAITHLHGVHRPWVGPGAGSGDICAPPCRSPLPR